MKSFVLFLITDPDTQLITIPFTVYLELKQSLDVNKIEIANNTDKLQKLGTIV